VISDRAQAVRVSLRTSDPAEVKARLAAVDAYLENVWRALREDEPVSLTNRQATALAGELYRAWAEGEGRERAISIVHTPGVGWQREPSTHVSSGEWDAALGQWEKMGSFDEIGSEDDPSVLEKPLGAVLDRRLLAKGIRRVDESTRAILLVAFWQAMRDATQTRMKNAQGDYSADPTSQRFPEWVAPQSAKSALRQSVKAPPPVSAKVSLTGLVETWWIEAKATGRKPSTHESYANTMAAFVDYLAHDDASRVTRHDVVGFKDHRLASINPRTRLPLSAKTVKDSDLSALKTILRMGHGEREARYEPSGRGDHQAWQAAQASL
jgi:hypothetical protein